jgi:hypothetical protein
MSDSVKKIVVTGGSAVWTPPPTEADGTRRARRAPTTRRRTQQPKFAVSRQDGGNGKEGNASPPIGNTKVPTQSNETPNTTASNKVIRYVVTPEPAPVPFKNLPVAAQQNDNNSKKITKPTEQTAVPAADAAAPPAGGGGTTKVVIGEKKPRHVKVILTKKRARTPDAAPKVAEKAHKVKLKTGRLRKVMRRAQMIRAKAAELPLEKVRAELVKEGIIRAASKAPESMLRQMFADAKILSAKTL